MLAEIVSILMDIFENLAFAKLLKYRIVFKNSTTFRANFV